MKKIAILQCSSDTNAATEALDVALSLASFDHPVQLILSGEAVNCLLNSPSKRYGMLELLDAQPIAISSESTINIDALSDSLDTVIISANELKQHLDQFHEVLQFS